MDDFLDVLAEERAQVADRLESLEAFHASSDFQSLDNVHKGLLFKQKLAMGSYIFILDERLKLIRG